jgi:hypothetical protein
MRRSKRATAYIFGRTHETVKNAEKVREIGLLDRVLEIGMTGSKGGAFPGYPRVGEELFKTSQFYQVNQGQRRNAMSQVTSILLWSLKGYRRELGLDEFLKESQM